MKKLLLVASVLVLPASAQAQPLIGPYVSLLAGGGLQPAEKINLAPSIGDYGNRSLTFSPGFAGGAALGYGLGYGFRVEIEGTYNSNHVKSITGDDATELRAGGLQEFSGGMANLYYDLNWGIPVYPFIGAGVGFMGLDHSHFSRSVIGFTFPVTAGEQTVSTLGYQLMAGVNVPLHFVDGLYFTAEYRLMGQTNSSPAFAEDYYAFDGSVTPYSRRYNNGVNHSVLLGFTYAFLQLGQAPAGGSPTMPAIYPVPTPYTSPSGGPPPMRTYLVFFDWDRADLSERARSIVAQAAQASTQVQTTRIDVSGYTDLSGTPEYNHKLSLRRAQSVESELMRDGVPQSEIDMHGYGESKPLVPTAQGVREPQNRRVEIVLH